MYRVWTYKLACTSSFLVYIKMSQRMKTHAAFFNIFLYESKKHEKKKY